MIDENSLLNKSLEFMAILEQLEQCDSWSIDMVLSIGEKGNYECCVHRSGKSALGKGETLSLACSKALKKLAASDLELKVVKAGSLLEFAMIEVHGFRDLQVGGGTRYDLLVPIKPDSYRPKAGHFFATVVRREGNDFYRLSDALRTPELDSLELGSEERLIAFRAHENAYRKVAFEVGREMFPEIKILNEFPEQAAHWNRPSSHRIQRFDIKKLYLDFCDLADS